MNNKQETKAPLVLPSSDKGTTKENRNVNSEQENNNGGHAVTLEDGASHQKDDVAQESTVQANDNEVTPQEAPRSTKRKTKVARDDIYDPGEDTEFDYKNSERQREAYDMDQLAYNADYFEREPRGWGRDSPDEDEDSRERDY